MSGLGCRHQEKSNAPAAAPPAVSPNVAPAPKPTPLPVASPNGIAQAKAAQPASAQPSPAAPNAAGQPGATPPGVQPDPHADPPAPGNPLTPENGTAYARPNPGEEPKIVFDRTSHDYGEVREGLELPTTFEFRNDGPGPLKILNTRGSCGCTLGEISVGGKPYVIGDPIAPGGTGVVKVVLRTANFSGPKDTHLDILTNDPAVAATPDAPFGQISLKLHAMIQRMFEWENNISTMSLGAIPNTSDTEKTLTLRSSRNEPFQIVGFKPAPTDVQVDAEPTDDSGTQWKIKLTVPSGLALGSFTKQFVVETKPEAPNLSFTVMGVVRGAVDVSPPNGALFGVIPKGKSVAKNVVFTSTHPTIPLKLTDIRLVDPKDHSIRSGGPGTPIDAAIGQHIELQHAVNEPGKVDSVTIVVKDTMPQGAFTALLIAETGIPDGPARVTVPIHGFVR
ncbi:MAG TPA: DUF1573 domain-containing protein [Planctomycetota bacterium]|nr:DUF1573 domain-containing protein [Planctomycetota bacterium]